MIKRSSLRILMLAAVLAIAGCGDDSPTGPDNRGTIMPLKVGNQWAERIAHYDTLGNLMATTFDTLRLTGTKVVDGETWYTTNSETVMFTIRTDGLWSWEHHPDNRPVMAARYPASVGDAFEERSFLLPGATDSVRADHIVASVNYPVTIAGVSYSCVQYKTRYRLPDGKPYADQDMFDGDQAVYLAPNVGYVMHEEFAKTSGGRIYMKIKGELTPMLD